MLTGDARSKLRDSVFNFDVFSPNPNTLYRQRHSMLPSHSSDTDASTTKTRVMRETTRPATLFDSTIGSSSMHRVIRSTMSSKTGDRSAGEGIKKSSRGIRTKVQIDFDSDDITSPLHISPAMPSQPRTRESAPSKLSDAKSSRLPYHDNSKLSRPQSTRRAGTPTRKNDMKNTHDDSSVSSLPDMADQKSQYMLRSSHHKSTRSEMDILSQDMKSSLEKSNEAKRRPMSMKIPQNLRK